MPRLKQIVVIAIVGLVVSIGVGFSISKLYLENRLNEARSYEIEGNVAVAKMVKPLERFTVKTTNNTTITIPIEGKVNIITPQYVRCPDICHMETQMMLYVMNKSIEEGFNDKIVFVTLSVDPWNETPRMANTYMKGVAGNYLDHVEWIWVLDSVDTMQRIYNAYGIYVEKDFNTTLVTHWGGFIITDTKGNQIYVVNPDWNNIPASAKVLYEKVKEVVEQYAG